jgi:adenosylhomocysteine nucleosidase
MNSDGVSKESPIGIIMATRLEAAPFVEALGLAEVKRGRMALFEGEGVFLMLSGIGKTNAAIATAYCCTVFRPRWVLNLGAAGAAKISFPMGGIFHIAHVIEYDRPLFSGKGPRHHRPYVLSGYQEATLATQDRPVITRDHREEVARFADLVDMEGAAVVQAAHRFDTPCVLFKFVSDTPDHPDEADIIERIGHYSVAFCRFVTDSVIPALKNVTNLK